MTKTPKILQFLYPDFIWEVKSNEKKIYLTFDDGPIPEITEFVLDSLEKHKAKATFFCVGENIQKNPSIFDKILNAGHSIGNHTSKHLKGWNTENTIYVDDYKKCQKVIEQKTNTQLFRPPYGRIKRSQAQQISHTSKIVMWSVLTRDYDFSFDENSCLKRAIRATKNGSIVLFHDSLKAKKNLYFVLPRYLAYFSRKGYVFESLDSNII